MKKWGFSKNTASDKWPKTADGSPVEPAFFQHMSDSQLGVEMMINLLDAYDIPVICRYPGDGAFGKVLLGISGNGADLYVPSTMLEDALNIASCEIVPEGEEE